MNPNNTDNRRRRGPRREAREREFEQQLVDVARVTRVTAGGKRLRFRACVVIGDQKGKVGAGVAKGADVSIAIDKAVADAKKKMIKVPMVRETIPHKVEEKYKAAKIMIKPAPVGTGVIAGGPVRIVLEMAGIGNIVSKMLGSKNKINNVRAAINALSRLRKAEASAKKDKAGKESAGKRGFPEKKPVKQGHDGRGGHAAKKTPGEKAGESKKPAKAEVPAKKGKADKPSK